MERDGTRTHDLLAASETLFQLSYTPIVLRPRFELGLSDRKSDGLDHWPNGAFLCWSDVKNPDCDCSPDFPTSLTTEVEESNAATVSSHNMRNPNWRVLPIVR